MSSPISPSQLFSADRNCSHLFSCQLSFLISSHLVSAYLSLLDFRSSSHLFSAVLGSCHLISPRLMSSSSKSTSSLVFFHVSRPHVQTTTNISLPTFFFHRSKLLKWQSLLTNDYRSLEIGHSIMINDAQLQKTSKDHSLKSQATLTQPLHRDLQRLICKTQ